MPMSSSSSKNRLCSRLDAPGSLDQLVDKLRNDYSVALPGAAVAHEPALARIPRREWRLSAAGRRCAASGVSPAKLWQRMHETMSLKLARFGQSAERKAL
jgi:hypothetical protein